MRRRTAALLSGLAALTALSGPAAGPAAAQTIWRCGPDARQFQATPCAGGEAVAIKPGPTPDAVAQARAVAARERLALQSLSAQRQARERDAVAGPGGIARPGTDNSRKAQGQEGGQAGSKAGSKADGKKAAKGRKAVRPSSAGTGPEA